VLCRGSGHRLNQLADQFPHLPRTKAHLIKGLLERKRTRDQEQAFVIEGTSPVIELLRQQSPGLVLIALSRRFVEKQPRDLLRLFLSSHAPVYELDDYLFERLSDVESTQGILAVVRRPVWAERAIWNQPNVFGLFGDQIQDPGNVGTLIRIAAAFGVSALWLTRDSADVFSPKIIRATAGAVLRLPIFHCLGPEVFSEHACTLLAAETSSSRSISLRDIRSIPRRAVLAVGNESRGLAKATFDAATVRFHIPIEKEVESLNVAAAAAISLFYLSGLPRDPATVS
jgi:TrmH family RNA methyltransferase